MARHKGKRFFTAAVSLLGSLVLPTWAAEPPGQTYNINLVYTSNVTSLSDSDKARLGELGDAGINTILVDGWSASEIRDHVAKARGDAVLSRFRFLLDVSGVLHDTWAGNGPMAGGAPPRDVCNHGSDYLPQALKDFLSEVTETSLANADFVAGYYTFDEPALYSDGKPSICRVYQEAVRHYIRSRDTSPTERPVAVSNTLIVSNADLQAISTDAQDVAFVDQYGLDQRSAYATWKQLGFSAVPQVYVHMAAGTGTCKSQNLASTATDENGHLTGEPAATEQALDLVFGTGKPLARGHAYFAFRPGTRTDFSLDAANCSAMFDDIKNHLGSLPDIKVVSITTSPAQFHPGDTVWFSVVVRNDGSLSTNGRWLGVALQTDGECPVNGCMWGGAFPYLGAGQEVTIPIRQPWIATAGAHVFTAAGDDAQQIKETNEFNNTLARTINVGTKPDLVPISFSLLGGMYAPGSPVTFTLKIENQGSVAMPYGWLGTLYLVDGGCPATGCLWGGRYSAPTGLMPGESTDVGTNVPAWIATSGPHVFRALLDDQNVVDEISEANNSLTTELTVSAKPDLVVVAARPDRSQVRDGDSVPFVITIANMGGTASPPGIIGIAVHDSGHCLATGCPWAIIPGAIAPGETREIRTTHDNWSADNLSHTFEAVVDDQNVVDEADEGNNVMPFHVSTQ